MHNRTLKLGIYESMGYETCQGLPGSYGHIETDAKTFAEWGIDMVKMDKCHTPSAALTQEGQYILECFFLIIFTIDAL